jgi:hypothetical protein
MDVIGAGDPRTLGARWEPRPHVREELLAGLLDGGVAGPAAHDLENVLDHIRLLIEGDPDKLFGLSGLPGDFTAGDILDLVADAAGAPIEPDATEGEVWIAPEPVLAACEAMGRRLAGLAAAGGDVLVASGHLRLQPLYARVTDLAERAGANIRAPAVTATWPDYYTGNDRHLVYEGRVAMAAGERGPLHTHDPSGMQHVLAAAAQEPSGLPDLVIADHGFAGAAIEAGIETCSVADVNDPALIVARAQDRTDVVVVMDDGVEPDAYWPCFQAIAAAFPPG